MRLQEIPHHLFAIEFGTDLDGTQDFFQLFWPIVLSHRIDEASPLWSLSPTDLMTEKFEIILTMEGTTPETGNNIQVIILQIKSAHRQHLKAYIIRFGSHLSLIFRKQ